MGRPWTLLAITLFACSGRGEDLDAPPGADDAGTDGGGEEASGVRLDLLVPSAGPFDGGNLIQIVGEGFTAGTVVRVDGTPVSVEAVEFLSAQRLAVTMPAHAPGIVQVEVESPSGSDHLEYTYDSLRVEPRAGSLRGGLSVRVTAHSDTFAAGDDVLFGSEPCYELEIIDPKAARCRTPASDEAGVVPVRAVRSGGDIARSVRGFSYVDTPFIGGGTGGGPIDGSLKVTVVGWVGAIEDAYVHIGHDDAPIASGRTNEDGELTVDVEGLDGPLSVHAGHECYARVSMFDLDARDVVLYLPPHKAGGECPDPAPSRGAAPPLGTVRGHVHFPGGLEFDAPGAPWAGVPRPRENQRRIIRVEGGLDHRDAIDTLDEDDIGSDLRFPFEVSTRGSVRIRAFAGLENDDGSFTPYLLGVSGLVTVPPLGEREGIDLVITTPLDRSIDVTWSLPPGGRTTTPTSVGSTAEVPNHSSASVTLFREDLGAFGGSARTTALGPHEATLTGYPSVPGMEIRAFAHWDFLTEVSQSFPPDTETVEIGTFLQIPTVTKPGAGEAFAYGDPFEWATTAEDDTLMRVSYDPLEYEFGSGRGPWFAWMPATRRQVRLPQPEGVTEFGTEGGDQIITIHVMDYGEFDYQSFNFFDLATRETERRARNGVIVSVEASE